MSKADEVYEVLKRRIITGAFAAMADLKEEYLCKEFSISRTPLREAVLRLKDKGYVNVIPNKGTIVRPVSHHLIREIYDMRLLNEPYICCQAGKYMPKEKLLELRDSLAHPEDPGHDKAYYIELDSRMHTEILSYCGNSFLIDVMQNVYDHNERIRHFASDPHHDNSIQEHMAIIEAMIAGDEGKIEKSVLCHISASLQITENCFKEQPYF